MCVQLANAAMAMGGDLAGANGAIQQGGTMQALSGGLGALGDLAMGATRARAARADAAAERAAGQQRASRIRDAGAETLGAARAQLAASGVKVGAGSALDIERRIVRNVEQDAGVAILTGERRAQALDAQARYSQAAGINSALDGLGGAVDNWKRSRRATEGPGGSALAAFWRTGTTGD